MRTKLITALRLTAKAIEQGLFNYEWTKASQCNCGAVACALTGLNIPQMGHVIVTTMEAAGPTWTDKVAMYCPLTGMPENIILATLFKAGMTAQDIKELEYLANKKVLERITLNPSTYKSTVTGMLWWREEKRELDSACYANRENAVRYMRAWADMLEAEDKDDVPSPDPVPEEEPVPA